MKFGLNFFPSFRLSDMLTADYYEQCLYIAELADTLGYSTIKTVEHYFYEYGGHSPNPIVFLAALAARTRRIRLITGAVIPAFNNPFKLAGELAMLDNLSRGRLDAGFGRAFLPHEFDAYHLDMNESRGRFEEGIAVIKRLWTEDKVTHEGRFYQLRDIHLMPRPCQQPHPPIWIASVSSRESFVWAGQQGYQLMIVPFAGGLERTAEFVQAYRSAWREAGHTAGGEQVQMSFHCYLAETHEEAIEGFKRPIARYVEVFSEAVSSWQGRSSGNYQGYDRVVDAVRSQTWRSMIDGGVAYVGSPAEVVEQVRETRRLFGEVEPSMQINFGGLGEEAAKRTVTLFAQEVMPHFHGVTSGSHSMKEA